MPSPGSHDRTMQGLLIGFAQIPGGFPQLTDEAAEFIGRGRGGLWCSERHGDGIGDSLRPFADEPPVRKTEDAAPDPVEVDRNDRDGSSLDDAFKAPSE